MGRLFLLLSTITIVMIISVGAGVYLLSVDEIAKAKHDSAVAQAKSVGLSLTAQINILNGTLDKMAQDPEVLSAVTLANPVLLAAAATKLEKHLPGVLKIRLLLPSVNEIDEKTAPRMGFADLDMVRQTLLKNQSPSIQGDKGHDRHLAIARRITQNNQLVGIILASFDEYVVLKNLWAATMLDVYIELRQVNLVLGVSGSKAKNWQNDEAHTKVVDTDWEIYYQYAGSEGFDNNALIIGIIVVPVFVVWLAFFVGYRRLSAILTQYLQSLMKAVKDIMTHSMLGNYPVQLTEMNTIISTLMQFKRVLDNSDKAGEPLHADDFNMNITVSDDEDFKLDSFFDDPDDLKL